MTFLEKLKQDHPELTSNEPYDIGCPEDYGYETDRGFESHCLYASCRDCWNREICKTNTLDNNTINEREETAMETTTTTRKTKAQLLEEIDILKKQVADLDKYKQYEDCANELAAMRGSFVKAGFSEAEAFQFILTMLTSSLSGAGRGGR